MDQKFLYEASITDVREVLGQFQIAATKTELAGDPRGKQSGDYLRKTSNRLTYWETHGHDSVPVSHESLQDNNWKKLNTFFDANDVPANPDYTERTRKPVNEKAQQFLRTINANGYAEKEREENAHERDINHDHNDDHMPGGHGGRT